MNLTLAMKYILSEIDAQILMKTVKHETEKSWLVNDGDKDVWLPKSQAEKNDDNTFTMPEWLAIEKRFI